MAEKDKRYRILVGINYGVDAKTRREPGDVVSDIPPRSVSWLLEQGVIEKVEEGED